MKHVVCFYSLLLACLEVFGITQMPGNRSQWMPDANFLTQKMPDERFSRICKLVKLKNWKQITFSPEKWVCWKMGVFTYRWHFSLKCEEFAVLEKNQTWQRKWYVFYVTSLFLTLCNTYWTMIPVMIINTDSIWYIMLNAYRYVSRVSWTDCEQQRWRGKMINYWYVLAPKQLGNQQHLFVSWLRSLVDGH